jgi:hypothetical protein
MEVNLITTFSMPYRDGELRIGWSSWDNGALKSRSIKYAYKDASGKISRGSPEVPLEMLVDMLMLAAEKGELEFGETAVSRKRPPTAMKPAELREEKRVLSAALICLQQLMAGIPWAHWQPIYDEVGAQLAKVRAELGRRR